MPSGKDVHMSPDFFDGYDGAIDSILLLHVNSEILQVRREPVHDGLDGIVILTEDKE